MCFWLTWLGIIGWLQQVQLAWSVAPQLCQKCAVNFCTWFISSVFGLTCSGCCMFWKICSGSCFQRFLWWLEDVWSSSCYERFCCWFGLEFLLCCLFAFGFRACGHSALLLAVGRFYMIGADPMFWAACGLGRCCGLVTLWQTSLALGQKLSVQHKQQELPQVHGVECQCLLGMFRDASYLSWTAWEPKGMWPRICNQTMSYPLVEKCPASIRTWAMTVIEHKVPNIHAQLLFN